MKTTNKHEADPVNWGPLVLHIRAKRQWYGKHGISQGELAQFAGISTRRLYFYETCRDLPSIVKSLLRISLALRVPVENLFDPRVIEKEREVIDRRRKLLPSKSSSYAN